jgi:hypothetical protein
VRDARDVIGAMHALAVRQTTGRLGEGDIWHTLPAEES